MQFSVPQFTDIEDKIIGSLTVKQFGIIFAAGVIIFTFYSLTKSLAVLIAASILVGLPALGIAFAKINGRPMYVMFGFVTKFILSPKILIFHKESLKGSQATQPRPAETKKTVAVEAPSDPKARLKEVNRLLAKNAEDEEDLLKKMR